MKRMYWMYATSFSIGLVLGLINQYGLPSILGGSP